MKKDGYVCAITSADTCVNFRSSLDLYPFFTHEKYSRFIPEFDVMPDLQPTPFLIRYENDPQCRLTFGTENAEVFFPWSEMRKGETLLYLAYPFIETQHQIRSRLTAHAACVSLENGKGILLLGKQGAGKTSLAIELCRQFKSRLVANDLCILGHDNEGLYSCGGSKFFLLRYEVVKRNLPDLLKYFNDGCTGDTWLTKTIILPETLEVLSETGHRISVKNVYLIHIDETKSDVFISNADTLVMRLFLNENFSRYIRGICTPMLGGEHYDFLEYVPSFDCKKFFENRRRLMNFLLYELGVLYISGPLWKVAEFIALQN